MNSLFSVFNPKKDLFCKVIALFIALSSITGGILLPQPFYFGSLALLGLLVLFDRTLHFSNGYILAILFVCLLSLVLNNPPSYFRAWQRLGVYSLVVLVASPVFIGERASELRVNVLRYFIYIGILLSIGSFFAYFLGINLFVRNGEELEISAGKFSGLMNHSMVLGPIAGLSCIYLFSCIFSEIKRSAKFKYAVLSIICLMSCFLAASRAAVGATLAGCFVTFFRLYKHRLGKMSFILVALIGTAILTFPIWGGMTDFLVQKQLGNEAMGSAYFSRERKFTARVLEFKSSPVYGIGYNVVIPEYDGVVMQNGQIEPGSSWLAIASMTGILGLTVFLIICFRALKNAWRLPASVVSGLFSGLLVFFFVHMIAEGYIFAPKNCLSLMFWLLLAAIDGCWYENQITNSISL